jgi:hypothetical protein
LREAEGAGGSSLPRGADAGVDRYDRSDCQKRKSSSQKHHELPLPVATPVRRQFRPKSNGIVRGLAHQFKQFDEPGYLLQPFTDERRTNRILKYVYTLWQTARQKRRVDTQVWRLIGWLPWSGLFFLLKETFDASSNCIFSYVCAFGGGGCGPDACREDF